MCNRDIASHLERVLAILVGKDRTALSAFLTGTANTDTVPSLGTASVFLVIMEQTATT